MNDSQIGDLLRALGFGLLAADWIGDLIASLNGRPGVTGYAGVALTLFTASLLFDGQRWARRRIGHKRFVREVHDKASMGHFGGAGS
jgi:hypothetical protein